MIPHTPIDLYVQAVDLAKEKEGLSNQDKLLLNRFKMLLRSGAMEDADSEIARMGKVRKKTIHNLRELAESIFEDWGAIWMPTTQNANGSFAKENKEPTTQKSIC